MSDDRIPRCCTKEDFLEWAKLPPKAGEAGFCEDCTPSFKKKMMDAGLCDHPEIRFCRDGDGFLNGLVKKDQDKTLTFDLFTDLD